MCSPLTQTDGSQQGLNLASPDVVLAYIVEHLSRCSEAAQESQIERTRIPFTLSAVVGHISQAGLPAASSFSNCRHASS